MLEFWNSEGAGCKIVSANYGVKIARRQLEQASTRGWLEGLRVGLDPSSAQKQR